MKHRVCFIILLSVLISCGKDPVKPNPGPPAPAPVALAGIQPADVFGYFEKISSIPRNSGDTKAISDYIATFAREHKLEYVQDDMNNVVIYVPASKGYEKLQPLILQSHLDMVCVSTNPEDNPKLVGVKPVTDGEYVWAEGTSLGGDNGNGVAVMLAVLTNLDKLPHPALEAVFTIDEEIGLCGAIGLDKSLLKARRMISFDGESIEQCVASSAGLVRINSDIPAKSEAIRGFSGLQIEISGLLGGHSGLDIHKERSSAITLLSNLLQELRKDFDLRISSFKGGTVANAITPSCKATIAVPQSQLQQFQTKLSNYIRSLTDSLLDKEPGLTVDVISQDVEKCLSAAGTRDILGALCNIPDGCLELVNKQAVLSSNTGVVELQNDTLSCEAMMRYNKSGVIDSMIQKYCDVISRFGGSCKVQKEYGIWEYKEVSPLRDMYIGSALNILGRKPAVTSLHAGFECSVFSSQIPDMDIICVGANLSNPHSVYERVEVKSMENLYAIVCDLLQNIK